MKRWKHYLAIAGIIAGSSVAVVAVMFLYLGATVPTIEQLKKFEPKQATRVYDNQGHLVGLFFEEIRFALEIEQIPEEVRHAFLAAEDANFYSHKGLDYFGILRAAIKNLRPGAHLQGASTITQQTVKTLIVGSERSYFRKMREAILARNVEQMLTKDEILELYLNQVYFGHGAYGVEAAATLYFGKSVRELTLGESAYLASALKNPNRYNIRDDRAGAKARQTYVLEQMVEHDWADEEEAQKEINADIPTPHDNPYLGEIRDYLEIVRSALPENYKFDVSTGGMKIYVGMNGDMQLAAQRYVQQGLEELTQKQGYLGPRLRIEVDQWPRVKAFLHTRYEELLERRKERQQLTTSAYDTIWDLEALTLDMLDDEKAMARAVKLKPLRAAERTVGVVEVVNKGEKVAWIDLGGPKGRIDFESVQWAGKFSGTGVGAPPRSIGEVFNVGDVVLVEIDTIGSIPTKPEERREVQLRLVPTPKAEGALVAIDPATRHVLALVGGYNNPKAGFNRAVQAKRQPGSAFKPILYATAIKEGVITPASLCPDSPVVIRDPWTGEAWKPQNYEDGKFDGNITYRTALTRSKNTCSVKLIEKLGYEKVIETAHAMGVGSELPKNLTLALGSGDLAPIELANAYTTLAAGGLFAEPLFVRKIVDIDGNVLQENEAVTERVLPEGVAYVVTHMMQSVVRSGTAVRAQVLDRPVAGKTGTTNESRNTWFAGFSPQVAAVVWTGFDDNKPMGRFTGSSAALPTWIRFMGMALHGKPPQDFHPPQEIVFTRIDEETGLPAAGAGTIEEVFIAGTEPQESTTTLPSIFTADPEGPG